MDNMIKWKIGLPFTDLRKLGLLLFLSLFYILLPLQAKAGTWTSVGPYGGDVKDFAISPNYATDQTFFAGTSGGVFKSTNGGGSWSAVNTGLSDYALDVRSISISPGYATDQTIFAGTYTGVFKSINGGGSWSAVNTGLSNINMDSLSISPYYGTDQTIFAGNKDGVFKSTNGGGSWTAINTGLSNPSVFPSIYVRSLSISPNYATDQTIFAGTWGGGVFKSTNGGGSWSAVNTGVSSLYVQSLVFSPNYATDQTIFAGTWSGGVFKSTNGGASWSAVNTGLSGTIVWSLSISPNYATDQTIFAGTYYGVFKSTNGSGSWSAVNTGLGNLNVYSLTISPNYVADQTIFSGTRSSGVFKSTNGGGSWSEVSTGLSDLYVLSLSLSPNYATDQTIFVGTSVGGGVFKSTNGGGSWSAVNTGLNSWQDIIVWSLSLSPNYATDQTIFGGIDGGVSKSTNGGGSWSAVNTGLSSSIVSLSLSPNYTTDQTIFAGTTGGVLKSTNGGGSWSGVNTGLSNLYVPCISISPNYATDQTIFGGTYGGVFKSTNGGGSWSAVNTGLSNLYVKSLSISPNYANDQTIFAGTNGGGVFKSTNGGGSWSAVNTGLSSTMVYSLSLSPNYATDQTIFAGTSFYYYGGDSVFKSTNGGGSWSAVINTGLSNINVRSLSISPDYPFDGTLFAGTWGSSVWKYVDDVCSPSPEVCNGIDDDCDGLIDEGVQNTYYQDADSDLYGNASVTTLACTQPSGYVSNSSDCNDNNAFINPGATEACNGVDDNCNGQIDEGFSLSTYYRDADSDTYGNASLTTLACIVPTGYVSDNTDCNDASASINPAAAEICNGVDDNCNGQIDEACLSTADLSITNLDAIDPVTPAGQDVTYTITVTNNGPSPATGVIVTDVLDASLTLVSATPSQGAPCTGTGTITCNLGNMMSGSSATVTVVATTSTTPGMIGSTASVTATEPDLNTLNNSATQTTNVGDVSRQVGISTRGYVETGTNIMVGGFSFGGTVSKKVLIRGRGPSMSGAPYNFTGTLTNPTLEIYSGTTLFATVDDWQAGATMCNAPAVSCGTPSELQVALVDPCQPNVGQTTAPPGCMQEAALYITLPPGAYTAKLKGVNNGVGKGIIEVYDADTASLTMLGGISTRGKVLTGTDVMVGGFIVGAGSSNKTLLLRGRGPSMSGAPYNFTGTLSNPTLEVYSGQTLFATVDDWQSGAVMCNAPAISCGTPSQLQTALVDPCQPNVGQTTAPPGCTQESAMFITLPPGAYTAKLKGVNNGTGIGIFEVYEMP